MPENHPSLQCMEVWGGNRAVENGVTMPGLDVYVHARPAEDHEAGGDVHYISSCATGRIIRLMLADVAGHGQAAAETADSLRTLMRRFINRLDQGEAVASMNRAFARADHDGRFATALLGTFWTPTGELCLCNAGHPRPLLYRHARKAWSILDALAHLPAPSTPPTPTHTQPHADHRADLDPVDLPLGIEDAARYRQGSIRLAPNDLVILYTDSLTESRLPDGSLLGEQGLLKAAGAIDSPDPRRAATTLLQNLESLGAHVTDDLTLIVLSPNGLAPRLSLAERARVLSRILGSLFGADRALLPETSRPVFGGFFLNALNRTWNPSRSPRK